MLFHSCPCGHDAVSLNKGLGDVATVAVNCLSAGYDVTVPVLTYDNRNAKPNAAANVTLTVF